MAVFTGSKDWRQLVPAQAMGCLLNVCCVSLFQSHQARIATLYLPLFGLLIENVQRINVREVSPFPVNPGSVRKHIHICTARIRFLWLP